jgi:hypothetical protein
VKRNNPPVCPGCERKKWFTADSNLFAGKNNLKAVVTVRQPDISFLVAALK